jgi:uncharacterized protein (DUF427 family)
MARERKIPGPDHPITIEPSTEHVVVRAGETVIAETSSPLVLRESTYPAAYYVPLSDVDPAVLAESDTQTYCPYKGDASYYSVKAADGEITDAIWTYREPYEAVAQIAGHVAFYPDRVSISVTSE